MGSQSLTWLRFALARSISRCSFGCTERSVPAPTLPYSLAPSSDSAHPTAAMSPLLVRRPAVVPWHCIACRLRPSPPSAWPYPQRQHDPRSLLHDRGCSATPGRQHTQPAYRAVASDASTETPVRDTCPPQASWLPPPPPPPRGALQCDLPSKMHPFASSCKQATRPQHRKLMPAGVCFCSSIDPNSLHTSGSHG